MNPSRTTMQRRKSTSFILGLSAVTTVGGVGGRRRRNIHLCHIDQLGGWYSVGLVGIDFGREEDSQGGELQEGICQVLFSKISSQLNRRFVVFVSNIHAGLILGNQQLDHLQGGGLVFSHGVMQRSISFVVLAIYKGSMIHQIRYNIYMSRARSQVEGSTSFQVLTVDIGSILHKESNHRIVAVDGSQMEGRLSVEVLGVGIGSRFNEGNQEMMVRVLIAVDWGLGCD